MLSCFSFEIFWGRSSVNTDVLTIQAHAACDRLRRFLIEFVEIHGHFNLDPAINANLLQMSAVTIDWAMRPFRENAPKTQRRSVPANALRPKLKSVLVKVYLYQCDASKRVNVVTTFWDCCVGGAGEWRRLPAFIFKSCPQKMWFGFNPASGSDLRSGRLRAAPPFQALPWKRTRQGSGSGRSAPGETR